jgi:beta-aspartyl-peptidase (threonine type)
MREHRRQWIAVKSKERLSSIFDRFRHLLARLQAGLFLSCKENNMNNRSDGSGDAAVIGLVLVLLLLVGGVGIYYVVGRQQMAVMQAERARMAEAQARMQAVRATSQYKESSRIQDDSIRTAVESVLRAQEVAWNRSDLDAFMDHYWKSDALTFSSGGKTTRGWNATLDRYRERYPTPEKMGRVKMSGLEITPLGQSAALVLGQWSVERETDPLSGNFSLVVRKFDDRWLIVHDHTSQMAE